jgi:hypothetical protein
MGGRCPGSGGIRIQLSAGTPRIRTDLSVYLSVPAFVALILGWGMQSWMRYAPFSRTGRYGTIGNRRVCLKKRSAISRCLVAVRSAQIASPSDPVLMGQFRADQSCQPRFTAPAPQDDTHCYWCPPRSIIWCCAAGRHDGREGCRSLVMTNVISAIEATTRSRRKMTGRCNIGQNSWERFSGATASRPSGF